MNYLLKIDHIIEVLAGANELGCSEELTELKSSVSTGSELLMAVTHRLKQMIEQDEKIEGLIGEEVRDLVFFCDSIGLSIK
ncbi:MULTISPECIES: hypothetical protein [Cyclobacteriaceae]|uniref:Uncharacterized protein n=2 Tax=Cyclobacteriaceae TaxID=563798 RepID=S2DXM0_INDAL|nr:MULTISPECIES: hypothetical protein [Cyclobacteriaceae]EOZ96871.1 hypothetical protein A33Q_2181 [Indibacter alkaliphilus LW1]MBW3469828.1 hypothetical protein [Arthrospiribacter ruber]